MGNKFVGISPAIRLYLHAVMRWCVKVLQAYSEGRLDWAFKQADTGEGLGRQGVGQQDRQTNRSMVNLLNRLIAHVNW